MASVNRDRDVRLLPVQLARLERVLAVVFAAVTLPAVVVPTWIEETTGPSPDGGDGETELWLGVPFGFVAVALAVRSWQSRHRVLDVTD